MNYYKYNAFDLAYASQFRNDKTDKEIKFMDSVFKRIKSVKATFGLFLKDEYINSKNKHVLDYNKLINPDNNSVASLKRYEVNLFEKDDYSAIILGELSKESPMIIYKKIDAYYKVLYLNFPDKNENQILSFDNHERTKKKENHDEVVLMKNIKQKNKFILEVIYNLEDKISEMILN